MRNRAKITQISKLESGDIQRFLCIGVTGMQIVLAVWRDLAGPVKTRELS